jgi:hypothetical protein
MQFAITFPNLPGICTRGLKVVAKKHRTLLLLLYVTADESNQSYSELESFRQPLKEYF